MAGNLRTLQALAELEGKTLPGYVREEFDAFLRCGILAYGFLRLGCEDCGYERLLAFSCKKRGFCTSCGGRRMVESAAHLVDEVFPRVGVRQWVLSFPMPVRFILAKNPALQAGSLRIVHRVISGYLRRKARQQGLRLRLEPGAVTLIQRFGGSLNLNVHFHMLFLEGGYFLTRRGSRFWRTGPPTDEDIQTLVATIARRVIRMLRQRGYFAQDVAWAAPETDTHSQTLLPDLQAASVQGRIALGERRGWSVRRAGSGAENRRVPRLTGPLCAEAAGFSLHAAVYCSPRQRKKLEMLCRYITRPAVAEERLELLPTGDIRLKLKHPYSEGTTHLVFSGLEFIEKLAALVPPPRIHLTRFFGCLAPHAKIRSLIVPRKAVLSPVPAPGQKPPKPDPALPPIQW